MARCEELESKILDRAAGALPEAEAASVQAHLDECAKCRAWAASCEEAVRLATLPEPAEAELQLFAQLPGRARAVFRERAQRSSWARPLAAGLVGAAALAAVLAVAGPRWQARRGHGSPLAAALQDQEQDQSELEAWALSDPLEDQEDQLVAGQADEAVDDGTAEPSDLSDLDLDTETTE